MIYSFISKMLHSAEPSDIRRVILSLTERFLTEAITVPCFSGIAYPRASVFKGFNPQRRFVIAAKAVSFEERLQKIMDDLESLKEGATGDTLAAIESKLEIVGKAYDLMKDKAQRMFESGITTMQGYLDEANLSITNCGTRSSKLELIKNRMQTQKTTFETLKSENEDVDITDVAIKLSSAQLTYEAALMATGKVTQTSLLNYI